MTKTRILPKTIRLRITKRDAENACEYINGYFCLGAKAALRALTPDVFFGSSFVRLDDRRYAIAGDGPKRLRKAYSRSGNRIRRGFKPFTITLRREP